MDFTKEDLRRRRIRYERDLPLDPAEGQVRLLFSEIHRNELRERVDVGRSQFKRGLELPLRLRALPLRQQTLAGPSAPAPLSCGTPQSP
jgi:hypothetical protein